VTLLEDAGRLAYTENVVNDEAISALSGTARNNVKVGDVDTQVVRVQPGPGYAVDLYVDAQGAYRRVVIAPDDPEARVTWDIDRYIEALPGKKVVGELHFNRAGSYVVDKFDANAAVSDEELRPPKPRATWTFGSSESFPVTLRRFTSTYGNTAASALFVTAKVNGQEGTFILDSGSAGILLFGNFARQLNLPKMGQTANSGVNGNIVPGNLVKIDALTIGGNVLHDVFATQSKSEGFPGEDGLIGYDVLANAIVDVDLDAQKMTILDPTKYTPTVQKGATSFPIDLSERVPQFHITAGNGADVRVIVDTGNSLELLLSEALRNSGKVLALTGRIEMGNKYFIEDTQYLGGVDGSSAYPVPCARLGHVQVGPYPYENVHVCFGPERAFGQKGGLLGIDFLKHFNWTFDYPDGKLILTPNKVK
jgi:predicted aspartyl protease